MSNENLSRHELGQKGEALARRFLEERGWTIVVQNWRCEHGELDLVAEDGPTLVFVEVRTRRGKTALETALASVDERKQMRLSQLVEAYCLLAEIPEKTPIRVDVVGVALERDDLFSIRLVQDALTW